ncbi:MAG: hypothetical protein RMI91_02280 [Gemmatales bacterium]|nr:hypothetical protein [Gemmatales bacterium]MDW7993455.1 hypothetical protein [Gemmatales bacterium]
MSLLWSRAGNLLAQELGAPAPPVYRLVLPTTTSAVSAQLGPPIRGTPPLLGDPSGSEARPPQVHPSSTAESSTPPPPSGWEPTPLHSQVVPGPRPQVGAPVGQAPKAAQPATPPMAGYVEPLEVPTPERLFRLESEQEFRERLRQEQRDQEARATFPADVPVAPPGVTYQGRAWPRLVSTIPAPITAYQPLYFEDKNVERYGWDAGIFQPLLSAGKFYLDVALLPYNLGAQWPWSLEYNAGYALPGDPEPYRLYWPRLSCTGAALESLAVLGILALP